MSRFTGRPLLLIFAVLGVVLIVAELSAGDGIGALWAALRVLGRLA